MKRWSVALICMVVGLVGGYYVAGSALLGQNSAGQGPAVTALSEHFDSFNPVVRKVLPAVVSIETRAQPLAKSERRAPRQPRFGFDGQIPDELRRFFEEQDRAPEVETPHHSFGSGFVVDPKGVILTNYHVVSGAREVEVTLGDGVHFLTRDIHGDNKTDLAIVRIKADHPLPYVEMGDSDSMQIGDYVLAVGAPFGLTETVTHGIISAKGRHNLQMNMYEDFIQTDAPINPGNSGGPLVNLRGQVIGINAAIKSRSGGFQGIGLAVASNLAKNIMNTLMKYGAVHRGYLGVQIQDLTPEIAKRLDMAGKSGVIVSQVFPDTPASKAGIKAGDVITALNGKRVTNGRGLQTVVAGLPLNSPSEVTLYRDGQHQTMPVTVLEQPDQYGTTADIRPSRPREEGPEGITVDSVGLQVTDLTPDLAETLGYNENAQGVVVSGVTPDSAASDAGLARGMLIMEVNKKPVKSARHFRELIRQGSLEKGVLLKVQTPHGNVTYLILKTEAVTP